jgi:chromosomal replication initiation ATPase DnaA
MMNAKNKVSILPLSEEVRRIVERTTGINPLDNTESHERKYVESRQYFAYMLNAHGSLSHKEIGALMGKDRVTAMHSIRNAVNFMNLESDYRWKFDIIEKQVKAIRKSAKEVKINQMIQN